VHAQRNARVPCGRSAPHGASESESDESEALAQVRGKKEVFSFLSRARTPRPPTVNTSLFLRCQGSTSYNILNYSIQFCNALLEYYNYSFLHDYKNVVIKPMSIF